MTLSCPVAISKQVDLLCSEDNVQKSIELGKEGLKQFPNSLLLNLFLAKSYVKNSDWAEAKEGYQKILQQDPRHLGAWRGLLAVYQELGDSRPLAAVQQKVADLVSPEMGDPLKASSLKLEGRGRESLEGTNASESADESMPYSQPTEISQKTKKQDKAEEFTEPSSNVATRTLAEIYLQQGLQKEALEIYIQLQSQDPDNVEIRERVQDIQETIKENSFT